MDKCCGTCKWHKYTDTIVVADEFYCGNPESDYYCDFTEYLDGEDCCDYEEKE